MNWISSVAGKAENFLNDLDHSAATALNTSKSQEQFEINHANAHYPDFNNHDEFEYSSRPLTRLSNYTDQGDNLITYLNSGKEDSHIDSFNSIHKSDSIRNLLNTQESTNNSDSFTIDQSRNNETNLLKMEVYSLNQEINSLIQRLRKSEEEITHLKSNTAVMESEKMKLLNNLRQLEEDQYHTQTQRCLNKEIEIASLKEYKEQLALAESKIASFEEEKKNLLLNQSTIEETLEREQKSREASQKEETELRLLLKSSHEHVRTLQSEQAEYREKAIHILQEKEKIIQSIRNENNADSGSLLESQTALEMLPNEMQVREEVEQLKNLLAQAQAEAERSFDDLIACKEVHRKVQEQFQRNLSSEKQLRADCEHELLQRSQEEQFQQERIIRIKQEFQENISNKDQEIGRLREMLVLKKHQDNNIVADLQEKVKSLTCAVVDKQNQIDALRADRHSLQESIKKCKIESEAFSRTRTLDSRLNGVQIGPGESFEDSGNTYHDIANRGISIVNRALGQLTRRYPITRFLILIYILMLHLAVSFLLLPLI